MKLTGYQWAGALMIAVGVFRLGWELGKRSSDAAIDARERQWTEQVLSLYPKCGHVIERERPDE